MGAIADVQPAAHVDAGLGQGFDFFDQRGGIHDHSRADHGVPAGAQNSAGDQLQNVAILPDDDGVAGVVATRYAGDVFEGAGQIVHHLAFAFIAPLRTHHHDRIHAGLSDASISQ